MAGLRDFFRARSKSRSPTKATVDKGKQPAMPPPKSLPEEPERPQTSNGPLPLMRPDSNVAKVAAPAPAPAPDSTEVGGAAYDSLTEGEAPTRGTYPLHGNARAKMPLDPGGPSATRYEAAQEGSAPDRGTYPLRGNVSQRVPSETRRPISSRGIGRSDSKASAAGRRLSGVRAPSSHRRSVPSGTAVSSDEPLTRTFSFNSASDAPPISSSTATRELPAVAPQNVYSDTSSSKKELPPVQTETRQPVQKIVKEWHKDQGPKQLEDTPAVPVIPGQYKGIGTETNGTGGQVRSIHQRVTSVSSSRASTSSRTPIADSFASSTWYGRENSPTAPKWSPVHDAEASESHLSNQSLDRDRLVLDESPQQKSQSPSDQRDLLLPPHTRSDQLPPPSRGRRPNRSIDKPLPVPAELKDAPWNRKEPVAISQPQTPKEEAQSAKGINDPPMAAGTIHADGALGSFSGLREALPQGDSQAGYGAGSRPLTPTALTKDDALIARAIPISSDDPGISSSDVPVDGRQRLPFERQFTRDPLQPFSQGEVRSGPHTDFSKPFVMEGSSQPKSLDGVVDLRNTEDTTTDTKWNPAVVRETVKPSVHHVREEQITREYHNHSYHHRILPIVDVQVLPAKHFVPAPSGSEGFVEVPAESIPGRAAGPHVNHNWVIAETVSRAQEPVPLTEQQLSEPRDFTARDFEGTEGDYKEWVGDDGVKRSESTWVYPPEIAQAPIIKGVTVPLVIDGDTPGALQQERQQTLTTTTNVRPPAESSTGPNAAIAASKAMSGEGQAPEPITQTTNGGGVGATTDTSAAKIAARAVASKSNSTT